MRAFADIQGDNSYHVVTISGASTGMIDGPTVIDGFTITGGFAKYSGFHSNGGGLNCDGHGNGSGTDAANCSPILRNLVFSGNCGDRRRRRGLRQRIELGFEQSDSSKTFHSSATPRETTAARCATSRTAVVAAAVRC